MIEVMWVDEVERLIVECTENPEYACINGTAL